MAKLSDSKTKRWTALFLLAGAMLFGYFFVDVLSPLQELLKTQRGWDSDAYGNFAGSETFLNVFVFFLIFAGIILDKKGVRYTAKLSGIVMLLGAGINCFAVSDAFQGSSVESFFNNILNLPKDQWWNVTPFYDGMPASAKMSALGFMLFGCGCEMAGITVSRGIIKWFTGHEMALAMGVEMAIARLGVSAVMVGSPMLAAIEPRSVARPITVSVFLLAIGLLFFIIYGFMDKKLEQQGVTEEKDEPFKVSDIKLILKSKVFWIVALLCVTYYSAIFPFQKYAVNMLQCNLGLSASTAGVIFMWFPIGAALITPFLGNYLDRKGKGATMLLFGAVLMVVCHLIFAFVVPSKQSVGVSQLDTTVAYQLNEDRDTINVLRVNGGTICVGEEFDATCINDNKMTVGCGSLKLHNDTTSKDYIFVTSGELTLVPQAQDGVYVVESGMFEIDTDATNLQKGAFRIENGAMVSDDASAVDGNVALNAGTFNVKSGGVVAFIILTLLAIVVLGISFSLVPAALWPSVPKLIDKKVIGSAYALIFWIQNIGLYAFPMIIGSVLKSNNPGIEYPLQYDYTVPMCVFASLGVVAILLAVYLKRIDKKGGYGLEQPNMKTE